MQPDALFAIATGLETQGFAVVENFLTHEECAALATETRSLAAKGAFKPAGFGRGTAFRVDTNVRSDQILWLDELTLTPAQNVPWARLEELRATLNRRLFLGLRWFEGHLAIYGAGGHYEKHVDRFQDASARTVSFALYLNPEWQADWGGALRVYDKSGEVAQCDVLPRGGTLVCFMSAEVPHEVLPPKATRYSLTGWFRTDSPR